MNGHVSMGLLPQQKVNYRSLCAGFFLQSLLAAVVVQLGVMQVVKVRPANHLVYTPLVFESQMTTTVTPNTEIKPYIPPVTAKVVVPRDVTRPQVPSIPEAPSIASLPPLPQLPKPTPASPSPALQTGSFLPVTAKPSIEKPIEARKVQTGGFGDPNGVKGHGDGNSRLTIASIGAFDLPAGPGRGNAKGGARGIAGVVSASGFGDAVAAAAPRQHSVATDSAAATPIEILAKPRPAYTEEGRQLRIEGEVQIEVVFTASGQARALRVVRGLGHGLDEQAVRAAEQIRFKPAMHEGRAVDSTAVVHIIFELAS